MSRAGLGPPRCGASVGFFFRSAGSAATTNDGGIDKPQPVAQSAVAFLLLQEAGQDAGPGAIASPTPKASIDALPRAIAFWDVTPGGAGVQTPEDTIEDPSVIF